MNDGTGHFSRPGILAALRDGVLWGVVWACDWGVNMKSLHHLTPFAHTQASAQCPAVDLDSPDVAARLRSRPLVFSVIN